MKQTNKTNRVGKTVVGQGKSEVPKAPKAPAAHVSVELHVLHNSTFGLFCSPVSR